MGFHYELEYKPEELIPYSDALRRMDFEKGESDNDRICFANNFFYFAQSNFVIQAENETELGSIRLLLNIMKWIKPAIENNVQKL